MIVYMPHTDISINVDVSKHRTIEQFKRNIALYNEIKSAILNGLGKKHKNHGGIYKIQTAYNPKLIKR